MAEFSAAWREDKSKKRTYPNGQVERVVLENILCGAKIVRRYNEVGTLIFTNEKLKFEIWRAEWLSSFFTPNT